MKKMLLVMVIAALLAAGCTEGSEEEIRRIASPFGDPLPGRIYYLAALLFATTAILFALGFAAAKVLLSEKVTGKHLLALTWVLVAMGVGWILAIRRVPRLRIAQSWRFCSCCMLNTQPILIRRCLLRHRCEKVALTN